MGQYGARVNVNLLGLFHKTAGSRWDLAVSPHIYAVTTKADIRTIADDAKVMKGIEASRITAVGNGSDGSLEAGKARRVETTDNNK